MSTNQSIILSSSETSSKKIEFCIEYLKDFYHCLCKQIKSGNNCKDYKTMKLIIEVKTYYVIDIMK